MPTPVNRNIRYFRTAGTQDTAGHSLYNNNFVVQSSPNNVAGEFLLPQLSASTGTESYYSQDIGSIFVIYTRPFISMLFTGNNHSFSASSFIEMNHDIYKIPYHEMEAYNNNPTMGNWSIIKNRIDTPLVTYAVPTSATITYTSTSQVYEFFPSQLTKRKQNFTEEVFEDRSQYFFNTRYEFWNHSSAYTDTSLFNPSTGEFSPSLYSASTILISNGNVENITQGPWSGVSTTKGLFFTCFQPPSKPIVEFPLPPTATTFNGSTFSPTFNFSNVEDGDEYTLQITYTMSDSGFTIGTGVSGYTTYVKQKEPNTLEQIIDKTDAANFVDSTTTRRTRRINASLKPDSEYLFRVGNVKSVLNIFGIKQTIVTYSDSFSGVTPSVANLELIVDSKSVSGSQSGETSSGQSGIPSAPPDIVSK